VDQSTDLSHDVKGAASLTSSYRDADGNKIAPRRSSEKPALYRVAVHDVALSDPGEQISAAWHFSSVADSNSGVAAISLLSFSDSDATREW